MKFTNMSNVNNFEFCCPLALQLGVMARKWLWSATQMNLSLVSVLSHLVAHGDIV